MTYHELVDAVRAAYAQADASEIKEHIAFQFNIEGEGEGAFYLEIADGKINIEPYEYYDRDVLFTTKAETLLKIGTGKLDPVLAFTIGKLKVEGNIDKALVLKKITPKSVEIPAQNAPADEQESAAEETMDEQESAAEETMDGQESAAEDTDNGGSKEAVSESAAPTAEKISVQTTDAAPKEPVTAFAKKRTAHKAKKKRR